MLSRRVARVLLGQTNRYTDGTGRKLDGMTIPKELFLEPISKDRYPARQGHFQPMIRGEPSPYKGSVLVVGSGLTGSIAASAMALRGWHVTVIDRLAKEAIADDGQGEMALVTKRAMDVLHTVGVRKDVATSLGHRVTGVVDHAGNLGSWLTSGLAEMQTFSVNMLVVDVAQLKRYLVAHVDAIPHDNAKVFDQHELAANLPGQKTAVVRRLRPAVGADGNVVDTSTKSVVVGGQTFQGDVEGVAYDVLFGCDGVDSAVRRFAEIPNSEINNNFSMKWISVVDCQLDRDCIHRWCTPVAGSEFLMSTVFLYPRTSEGAFSACVFAPTSVFGNLSDVELLKSLAPKLRCTVTQSSKVKPYPLVFTPHLYNANDMFPNTILLGDAAHTCHPFLMHQLSLNLEDVANAINNIDSTGKSLWDCVRQYSRERGSSGDSLRRITDRSLFFTKRKHVNPFIRFRNEYAHIMHYVTPRVWNEWHQGSSNFLYPRSVEAMLNGRGYCPYDEIDWHQHRSSRWWCMSRLYT